MLIPFAVEEASEWAARAEAGRTIDDQGHASHLARLSSGWPAEGE
jgi:hypothetical protein